MEAPRIHLNPILLKIGQTKNNLIILDNRYPANL